MQRKKFWRQGEIAALARCAGIAPHNLSATLHRRRAVSKDRAYTLESASKKTLGEHRYIRADHWLYNEITTHPAFFGKAHWLLSPKKKRGLKAGGRYGAE